MTIHQLLSMRPPVGFRITFRKRPRPSGFPRQSSTSQRATERRRLRHPAVFSTARGPVPRREIPSENAVGEHSFPRSRYRSSQRQTPDSRYATEPRKKRVSELKAKMMNIESAA